MVPQQHTVAHVEIYMRGRAFANVPGDVEIVAFPVYADDVPHMFVVVQASAIDPDAVQEHTGCNGDPHANGPVFHHRPVGRVLRLVLDICLRRVRHRLREIVMDIELPLVLGLAGFDAFAANTVHLPAQYQVRLSRLFGSEEITEEYGHTGRLVTPGETVPSAEEMPALRFYQCGVVGVRHIIASDQL